MVRRRLSLALALLLAATGSSRAGWFEISLNDEAFDTSGGVHLGSDPQGQVALGGRYLHDDEHAAQVASFFAGFANEPGSVPSGLDFAIGAQALYGESGSRDLGAVSIGVEGNWAPPRWKGAFIGGRVHVAPEVFTWADTQGYWEWRVRGGYRITPRIAVFVEYQQVEAEFEGQGDLELSDGVLFGFSGRF